MNALKIQKRKEESTPVSSMPQKTPAEKEAVRFLMGRDVLCAEDITDDLVVSYYQELRRRSLQPDAARRRALLLDYFRALPHEKDGERLYEEICRESRYPHKRRRVWRYLVTHGVFSADRISWEVRCAFTAYFRRMDTPALSESVKLLDLVKLLATAEENRKAPFRHRTLDDVSGICYLPYHPDAEAARVFLTKGARDRFVFDFRKGSKLSRDIRKMLNHIIASELTEDARITRDILALKDLYAFCQKEGIPDIERISKEERQRFYAYLAGTRSPKHAGIAGQILYRTRRFLFLEHGEVRWDATLWFTERFLMETHRKNPSFCILTLDFTGIRRPEDTALLQAYIRYLLGVSDMSLGVIAAILRHLVCFAAFLDARGAAVLDADASLIDDFVDMYLDADADNSVEKVFRSIWRFYEYLLKNGRIAGHPYPGGSHRMRRPYRHREADVPDDVFFNLLDHLYLLPDDERLMHLHLICTGLRINEICSLKAGDYEMRNGQAWLCVYQHKMKREKRIPIPEELYLEAKEFIGLHSRAPGEYLFQNRAGGAFSQTTFREHMNRFCKSIGITSSYRPHDYRHRMATSLYEEGVSIPAIRDYLGHTSEEMTKAYIDHIPKTIDRLNREYFGKEQEK